MRVGRTEITSVAAAIGLGPIALASMNCGDVPCELLMLAVWTGLFAPHLQLPVARGTALLALDVDQVASGGGREGGPPPSGYWTGWKLDESFSGRRRSWHRRSSAQTAS